MSMRLAAIAIAITAAGWTGAAQAAGDAGEGEKVFKRVCATCHIVTKEGPRRLGPTLFGLVGRKSGTVEGFRYSDANKNANIVWTEETLEPYLADPRKVVPGTTMAFAGVRKAEERADLIAYLAGLK